MLCELYTFRHSIFYMMLLGFSCISQFSAPQFLANASHKRHISQGKQAKKVEEFSPFFQFRQKHCLKKQNLCQTAEENATKESISLKENKYCKVKNKNHGRKLKQRRKVQQPFSLQNLQN